MQVSASQANITARVLYEGMSQDVMIKVVKQFWPDYNLHARCGIRDIIPIPLQDSARQIVRDIVEQDLYVDFVEQLLAIDRNGIMGRRYPIPHISLIVKILREHGYVYDQVNNIFLEDPRLRKTANWGRLKSGTDYNLCLLRLDIVSNSKHVRSGAKHLVEKAFEDVRVMVRSSVEKRLGRIWSWEGDGGLAAFFYGHRQTLGVYTAMEILHGLFLYNQFSNPLAEKVEMRLALISGDVKYCSGEDELRKNDIYRRVIEMEANCTPTNHLVISAQIEAALERPLAALFRPLKDQYIAGLWSYTLEVEK